MPRRPALAALAALALAAACRDDLAAPTAHPRPALSTAAADTAIATLAVRPDTAHVVLGRTLRLAAVARDSAGAALPDRPLAWTSSADSVARVDSTGTVTPVAVGTAIVSAVADGVRAEATVVVHDGGVVALALAPRTLGIPVGDTATLAAEPRDAQDSVVVGAAVRWTSSDTTVAVVDDARGTLRALARGSAVITAASGGARDSVTVTVTAPVSALTVDVPLDTLEAHDVRALRATFRDSAGRAVTAGAALAGRVVRWSVSDTAVARVDSVTGALTGVNRGTVTVTARSDSLAGTASRVVVIRYRSLVTATTHACDLASGGIAWCWGLNGREGRLGVEPLADSVYRAEPVRVSGGHRFVQLTTFSRTTCGLTADGEAWCWGYNGWGVLGDGSRLGQSATPVRVAGGLRFTALSAGAEHVCGVTTVGRAYCWGSNGDAEFGAGTRGTSSGVPVLAAGGRAFASVSGGNDFTCGVTVAGQGWCWGYNGLGNLGDSTKISFGNTLNATPQRVAGGHAFRAISASQQYACGVTVEGRGYCWGRSLSGRLGNGTTGEISWPQPVDGGHTFRAIAAGSSHACGVTTDDGVWCWGANGHGQLGLVLKNGSTRPVRAGGDAFTAAEVSTANIGTGSAAYTCAISADRLTTSCWGRNDKGQLGNGATTIGDTANSTPSVVAGQKPLPATAAGN